VISGGVFQNRFLLELATERLSQSGFSVFTNRIVPANDGGVSLGQVYIAASRMRS
jgi:hydrogenase maturation protein HypF